ncbi:MAG: hypothetical protein ACE5R6_16370 [Candidatus Heimdallarchaeota archaeon]
MTLELSGYNVARVRKLAFKTAYNLIFFRINVEKDKNRRELRIVKMEGESHPID